MQKNARRYFLTIGAIAIVYFLTAKLSLLNLHLSVQASPVWPPAGIAMTVLLWRIRWAWLGIALGSLWVNCAIHAPWLLTTGDMLGDTMQAVLGAFLLHRLQFRSSMDRLQDVLGFVVLAGLAAPLLGAVLSTLPDYLTSEMSRSQLLQNGWTHWLGDGMGVLVLSPLLLTVRHQQVMPLTLEFNWVRSLYSKRRLEKLLWLSLLILVSTFVFYANVQLSMALYPLEYLPFPVVLWAALRFGQTYTALACFVLSAIAISGTAAGHGPFAAMPTDAGQEVLLLQAFIGVITITALIVAAVTSEQQQTEIQMRLAAERNRLLSEIALKIRQSLDLNDILDRTVLEVRQFLQADRVFITHFEASGQGNVVAESVAVGWPSILGWTVDDPAVQQEIYQIFEHERIKVVNDTETSPRSLFIEQYHHRYQVRAGIGVPLMIAPATQGSAQPSAHPISANPVADSSYLFGVLVVNQCSAPRCWQPLEIELMQQLGTQVAIAIQQAQLYQQVQCLNATLEQQVAERTVQLRENMAELQELNQFRDVLIHAIAHDLRSTVIGTLMVLKNLQNQPGEKILVARTLLERMTDSGEIQFNKLNSLLEAYEYATAGVTLNRETTAIAPVVQSVVTELATLLEQNQVVLENQLPDNLPPLWVDASQIQRVFKHLLTNAIKHNPPGITITLQAEVEAEMLRCWVKDNGQGINPAQHDRLFDLRICRIANRQLMGISLGLYLCRQIISAHDGEIGMSSAPGQGSEFWFLLPLKHCQTLHP
ncbi:MAG TPA: MASE1 domain-containing protein [Coleofasciculaceae cyanobacterium]